uniref:Multiple epidermal growth factor-like domains protein 10 isoform X2 n=1 Tax=Crassostrea virginica TaxID=6565 RepID=A0A8B8BQ71_CRAVI|nr:multiple epidermal growth factor-like domains protein 10 isoform X2 [Crassostrea virginica]
MEFIFGIIYLTVLVLSTAYDDLSKNKNATQSTTALSSYNHYIAGNAVDRNITTCIRTNPIGLNNPDQTVWWKVDLGGVYNIYSVNILFKNYDEYENRQRGRVAGFSLFISNNGSMNSPFLCYKDGPQLPSLNFTTTCITSGRYVIFYNERLDGTTYPEGYELIAYTEICEVIVQGCKTSGVYGNNCKQQCPINCKDNVCDIQMGTCFGCKPGWTNTICQTKCSKDWYGLDCKQQCSGHCRDNNTCNHVTGQCNEGCSAGWNGSVCNKECEDGKFGPNCVHRCSGNCLNDSPCNRQTGHCDEGCKPGYTNVLCSKRCQPGFYGKECGQSCSGHCLDKLVCDHIDGTCSDGCEAGYIDKLCNTSCRQGFYGNNCSSGCSPNCKTCKHTDGSCTCYAGWSRPDCTNECSKSYGENCEYPCSPFCINQTCDPFNGTCLTRCKDKSYGDKCIAEIREEYVNHISNRIPEAVGGTVGACLILIVSSALFWIRRKKTCMSGKTPSLYAEIEIQRVEDSTYQQLNVSGLENENANQQQYISDVESNNTYQQLNVSELDPSNAYQQLNVTESNPVNTYLQLYDLGTDNANQQQNIYQN